MTLDFGLQIPRFEFPGHPATTAESLAAFARAAEEAGFTSLWVMDHFLQIPQVGREWEDMLESHTTLAYLAGVTSLGDRDVRLIIREVYQDPRNYGKVSFPTAAKSTDLRPYTKGTLVREDEELEEDLEDDIEDEEIENLDRVLPPEETTDEAFVEETDELEEP